MSPLSLSAFKLGLNSPVPWRAGSGYAAQTPRPVPGFDPCGISWLCRSLSVRPRPFESWKVVFCGLRAQSLKQEMLRLLLLLGTVDACSGWNERPLGPCEEQHRMQEHCWEGRLRKGQVGVNKC